MASFTITPDSLFPLLRRFPPPALLDVRREDRWREAADTLPGAVHRDPEAVASWAGTLEPHRPVVAFCVHGHEVSQGVAAALRAGGHDARILAGGIEGWRAAGLPVAPKPAPSLWVTRERPKIDRLACPWLIRRFLDPDARFLFVPTREVAAVAESTGATPFDVENVALTHRGDGCTFDTLIEDRGLADPALARLALMVRGADTAAYHLHPAAAGLFAASLGLSALFAHDDHAMLRHGFTLYDALYLWCRDLQEEIHGWPPKA
ncbi:chromate resistance protein ChrB domain-containing protein [Elioraea tepidiphila]|uniref:chromate resistance protein ChrB domain-containing protein n=1 Tax=Elioraea tepidiphila TaxID=457934 RepID=UPI0003792E98|nr:chromate resistance protein ChrB domain-containing protein [Elioraea tepidiphila]